MDAIEYPVTREELERLVGLGYTDAQIADHLTAGVKTASWAKDRRIEHKVLRRKGGAAQVGSGVVDFVFAHAQERDLWFDRVRHGDCLLDDVISYTEANPRDVYEEWRRWSALNHGRPFETPAARQAREAILDTGIEIPLKLTALFGRRFKITQSDTRFECLLDGERVTLAAAVEAGDEEARELGLPTISGRA